MLIVATRHGGGEFGCGVRRNTIFGSGAGRKFEVIMNFLLEVIEFTLAGFFVGLGFWFACVGVAFVCGLRKIMK